jgi:hypothetical protein
MLENVPSLDRFFAQSKLSAPHLLKLVKQFGPRIAAPARVPGRSNSVVGY